MVENPHNFVDLEPWKLYFDGSSQKEGTGIEVFIISPNNNLTKFKYRINGLCSNNETKYEALIVGLEILLELEATKVKISVDSELVVN